MHDGTDKAPTELEIGGKTYKLSPLTLLEMAEFEKWVASQRFREALDALNAQGSFVTAQDKGELMMRSFTRMSPVDVMRCMQSISGVVQLLWMSARKNHDKLTVEDMMASATFDDLNSLRDTVDRVVVPEFKKAEDDKKKAEGDGEEPSPPPGTDTKKT
jgi:hypothetical protein